MQVSEGMSSVVLEVGPGHSLRDAARRMADRGVGAAVVVDPEGQGPGIITERDLLLSLGRAAEAMVRGGFRHLVVVDGGETVGVLSMRDIVRCWTQDGASCDVPEG